MSKSLPWYKRTPGDWKTGTRGMSIELRGFYSEFLDAMWIRQGQLPKDPKWLSLAFECSTRLVRSIMPKLIEQGKVIETETGYYNARMMADILGVDDVKPDGVFAPVQAPVALQSRSSRARLVLDSCSKNTNLPMITTRDLESDSELDKEPPTPLQGATPFEALKAFEAWNATAAKCGLAQAAKLTPDRKRKIISRLKDYGPDGWAQALAHIERSSFLTGKNDRDWRATLDFLLQPASFSKVHDGTYGNGRHAELAAPVALKPHEIEMDREIAEMRRLGVEF